MLKALIIGLGGGVGAILRYVIGGYVQQWTNSTTFPYGTLAVNVLGCLFIGLLSELAETRGFFNPELRLFLFIGLLGGFTTYSTFGSESINLLRGGANQLAFGYVTLHLVAGLGAVWLGRILVDWFWK
ncbi:MAG: fluoride efflux transporter CrcB [Anaerolineae bacterium]|nr:fluoride efflux transporter CrcB [Anaerolineae bacterium]